VEHHSHVHLDDREIGEFVERILFRSASNFSSGFASANPVTGA